MLNFPAFTFNMLSLTGAIHVGYLLTGKEKAVPKRLSSCTKHTWLLAHPHVER